jgi:hypothetical protein
MISAHYFSQNSPNFVFSLVVDRALTIMLNKILEKNPEQTNKNKQN